MLYFLVILLLHDIDTFDQITRECLVGFAKCGNELVGGYSGGNDSPNAGEGSDGIAHIAGEEGGLFVRGLLLQENSARRKRDSQLSCW